MKNNLKNILKISFIILAAILFCASILWIVDQVFNGTFKEWFYNRFYVEPEYPDPNRIGSIFRSWYDIKQFFIVVFVISILVLTFVTGITTYLYAQYTSKKEITFITKLINSYLESNSDDLVLRKKYFEIEAQLIKIKTKSQKQQQLMQMEMQQKNDLITYLAHDLKTPLASVIGYLSLLDEAQDMPIAQKAKYVGVSLNKAYRLEELINEFFEITRFNLQSIILNKVKIKLAFMFQQMVDEFYPMLTQQKRQVVLEVPEDILLIGDADKLARVFNNILKNAIAYSYESSSIYIVVVQQENNVVISFTNQGDPIPPQRLETIFEKFYRLDSARSSDTGGAGLGLAIAREIIIAHGGSITAESTAEGTIFTMKLPS